jgi:hypothetical protein
MYQRCYVHIVVAIIIDIHNYANSTQEKNDDDDMECEIASQRTENFPLLLGANFLSTLTSSS